MKQKRIPFPVFEDLNKSELFISISDNVLDDDDYPIAKISLSGEFVTKTELLKSGIYSFSSGPTLGWNRHMILEWLNYDPTGCHPEVYHNLLRGFVRCDTQA